MKIKEVIVCEARQASVPQPSVVKQQQRVGKVMQQIAASDQQQEPSEMDKVLAMRRYAEMKKQTDKAYAVRLRRQLEAASQFVNRYYESIETLDQSS
jgi:hypothetical protein